MSRTTHSQAVAEEPTLRQWPGSSSPGTGLTALSGLEALESSGFTWNPVHQTSDLPAARYDAELSEATPSNDDLRAWAARPVRRPPQEWWDDTSDPFTPAEE